MSNTNGSILIRTWNNIILRIDQHEIYYVAADMRGVCIQMLNKQIESPLTLNEIDKELKCYSFIRLHRSFLVNMRFIEELRKKERIVVIRIREKRIELPVSRRNVTRFVKAWENF